MVGVSVTPVDAHHPQYDQNIKFWKRCRDCYEGEDTVKSRGEQYLPKPGGQDAKDFEGYRARAIYYEAPGRTIDGFTGAIARKDPEITLPAKLEPLMEDATEDGLSLPELIKRVCSEALLTGRGALLVDFDDDDQRPYLAFYTAENVINWREDLIVLTETVYEPDKDDKFKLKEIAQCRELALENGNYIARIWRKERDALGVSKWQVYETVKPSNRGKPLSEIPLYWITPLGRTDRISKPPLLGLINISLSHYRTSADLEHGRHFSGLPTLYVTGLADKSTEIRIGGTSAILIAEPDARVGYAEFTGAGLESLENALAHKEEQMAVLGAAVFAHAKKGVEAVETTRIRTSSETSLLMGVVQAVEACLESALTAAATWAGAPGSITVSLNREFQDVVLDPKTLAGLVAAYQAGALSLESFLYALQQGELLPPDMELDTEAAKLRSAAAKAAKDEAAHALELKKTAPPQPIQPKVAANAGAP